MGAHLPIVQSTHTGIIAVQAGGIICSTSVQRSNDNPIKIGHRSWVYHPNGWKRKRGTPTYTKEQGWSRVRNGGTIGTRVGVKMDKKLSDNAKNVKEP